MKANNNGWTEERKQRQREAIQHWQPWNKSTGAKTEQGKAVSKMNAQRATIKGLLLLSQQFNKAYRQLDNRGVCNIGTLKKSVDAYLGKRIISKTPKAVYCRKLRRDKRKADNVNSRDSTLLPPTQQAE